MDARDVDVLAHYNSERARGLVHTAEWAARMAVLQAEFDAEQLARQDAMTAPAGRPFTLRRRLRGRR